MAATSVSSSVPFWKGSSAAVWTVWLAALLLAGCSGGPCETTTDCGGNAVCTAHLCQQLSCGQAVYLMDPDSGVCTPLSGCFLTELQRKWKSCDSGDPCQGLTESACLADTRCQPAYATTQAVSATDCAPSPHGLPSAASVSGQDEDFHAPLSCAPGTERSYAGCRAVPTLPVACSGLDQDGCATRPDCQWAAFSGVTGSQGFACGDRRPMRSPDCSTTNGSIAEREVSCLVNPLCQPTGGPCYCPPGASCACSGGQFLGCEHNDRLPTCATDMNCALGETCALGGICPPRRDGYMVDSSVDGTGSAACQPGVGVCTKSSCEGLDEVTCHGRPDCTEIYATECSDAVSEYYEQCPLNPASSAVAGCLCDNVFQRCVASDPGTGSAGIIPERSLLVRDPGILTDPDFRIDAVLGRFAAPGDVDGFLSRWLSGYMEDQTLSNGATAPARSQLGEMIQGIVDPSFSHWLSENWHTTALINRLDLFQPGQCGEARISFAYNGGYGDVSSRMTLIVELKVPDDGQGCQQVAEKWAELSAIDDPATRLEKLKTLYDALLTPANLGQVRSNEFINPARRDTWEMREWHLVGNDLVLAPAKQAVDPRFSGSPALLAWVQNNLAALRNGTAIIPDQFLAAAVSVDGQVVRLPGNIHDATLFDAETQLNQQGCAGCHLGYTGTPFVHIGERLAQQGTQIPFGRAVTSSFLRQQLAERAATLNTILHGGAKSQALRLSVRAKVH